MIKSHNTYLLEACVGDYRQALRAQELGAHQIELCSRLDLDGLTPNFRDIELCIKELNIHTKVMIRPKAGSFVASDTDLKTMMNEIAAVKKMGVSEIVFGLTTQHQHLDLEILSLLSEIAMPMRITIHKAIDTCRDLVAEVHRLKGIPGVSAILTSGGAPTAKEGGSVIKSMITAAGNDINIIAAGRITNQNIEQINEIIGAPIYHGRLIVGSLE